MDRVSELLAEREHAQPGLLPWVGVAALLHLAVAGSVFMISRSAAARPPHLPTVSVRIIQPQLAPAPRARRPRSKPAPVATPVPRPKPTAVAAATPVPRPTAALQPPPSEEAMPAPTPQPAPAATPAPQSQGSPSDTADGRGGRGLSLGEGTGSRVPGIPSDFQFTYYIERMLALIESRWYKPVAGAGTRAQVRFRILANGRVEDIALEQASGNPSFDRAALRALYAANPLPPLPPAYGKSDLTVHLSFTE
jgi:periplasmic protein TonB